MLHLQDGIHQFRDSVTDIIRGVQERGLADLLPRFFDFRAGLNAGAQAAPQAQRRATRMTADDVQTRVNGLPTEMYATDTELKTRCVSRFVLRLEPRLIAMQM